MNAGDTTIGGPGNTWPQGHGESLDPASPDTEVQQVAGQASVKVHLERQRLLRAGLFQALTTLLALPRSGQASEKPNKDPPVDHK